ncbi:PARP3 polymerase, partial [Calcarius ornatus]|nr:PARP3 polymerase [Calcarius ornatus]
EEEDHTCSSTLATLKTAPKEKPPATFFGLCPLSSAPGARVRAGLPCHSFFFYEDYDCTLNQTNISDNNNKFYILQLLEHDGAYSVWSRWGRVGEPGRSKPMPCASLEAAKKNFEKKFREMTKNSWEERNNFVAHPGKYTLIEVQPWAGQVFLATLRVDAVDGDKACKHFFLPCTLDRATQDLVSLIFSSDMFRDAMRTMNIDVKLGKPIFLQITRGFEALEELEAALSFFPPQATHLEELSSRFYTIIPHNFGRARPPTIDSPELLRAKKDMLLVLADFFFAQSLQAQKEKEEEEKEVAHPLDQDYALLCCQLSLLDPASWEYQVLLVPQCPIMGNFFFRPVGTLKGDPVGLPSPFPATAIGPCGPAWPEHNQMGVPGMMLSFPSFSPMAVGCTSQKVGIMFLTEVALGKPYRITCDDPTLCEPPAGYDSVLACGRTEPDPAQDEEVLLDGKKVLVCQGKPIPVAAYKDSAFSQSEYLIYKESQCRLRFLVQLRF